MARKSVQHLGNGNGYGHGPTGGYGNGWDNKMGIKTNVTPAHQNGSTVW